MSKARGVVVAGFPNTGTTITAMILGQHPNAFATGELAQFPDKRHFTERNPCSCGQRVIDCAFWLGVRERYLEGPRSDARLYDLIAAAADREIVIDVAHDTGRVAALVDAADLDLRVVHMVRKRQAVLNSRLRRLYGRGIIDTYRPSRVQKIFKVGRRHQQFLSRMERIRESVGERWLEVDYDRLCLDPESGLARLGTFLGLDYGAVAARMAAGQPLERAPHLIRGNGRLRRTDTIVVTRDAEFVTELSPVDRWLYAAGAGVAQFVIRSGLTSDGR
jgi:hypothetical protein